MSDLDRAQQPLFFLVAFAVAVLFHALLFLCLSLIHNPQEPLPQKETPLTTVNVVDEEDPLHESNEDHQIISRDKPETPSEEPEKATKLDRYNQKVEEETARKRKSGQPGSAQPNQPNTKPQQTHKAPDSTDENTTPSPGSPDKNANNTRQQSPDSTPEDKKSPLKAPVKNNETPKHDQKKEEAALPNNDKPNQGDPANPGKPSSSGQPDGETSPTLDPKNILPNFGNIPGNQGSGPQDYLDVPEGDKDLLNRKKTRYWSFFDRMKTAVSRTWDPNAAFRLHDPRYQIYGVEDKLTTLNVTLNGDGSLHKIFVSKPSGAPFYDDEAIRAFRAAAPFPNPPEGIKDKDGLITLRFGFFLDIQSRGSRIIRFRR